MLALDAEMVVRSGSGERVIPALEFFESVFTTALRPDELLVELRIPIARPGQGFAFEEHSRRPGDFAIVGVAASVEKSRARLAFCGIGPCAQRAVGAEKALEAGDIEAACDLAASELDPPTDLHADAEYRRHLIRVLARRAITRAMEAANG